MRVLSTERGRVNATLAAIGALGVGLRAAASVRAVPLHPDEVFQYLEPAWSRLTGAGIETWEWQEGVRSWVLPFYNGAWMALLMQLGVRRGASIAAFLRLHWALVNASVILLAFRGGNVLSRRLNGVPCLPVPHAERAPGGFEGGLLAAGLSAALPLLVLYAAHTLSEMPSMLCLLAGLVITAEVVEREAQGPAPGARKQAALAGALLALGACLRIANGPLALVPPLWLLAKRKYGLLLPLLAGALLVALLFGVVDLFTWGRFAGSFMAYLEFNLIEGKAAKFGTEPPWWYVERIWESAPFGLPLLLTFALWGWRASWPYLVSALGLVLYLSTQPHKEERFVIGFWPLIAIAAAGSMGAWVARVRVVRASRPSAQPLPGSLLGCVHLPVWALLALLLLMLSDASRALWPYYGLEHGRVRCQQWVGARRDLTGLMMDYSFFGAGSMWIDNPAPQLLYERALLENPLLNYLVVDANSMARRDAEQRGFAVVFRAGDFVALRFSAP